MITVLYVDDEPALLDIAKLFLEKTSEFKVFTATSAKEGLELVKTKKPQAIVSDYYMPVMDGMAFLREIRKTSSVPFIMFTGRGSEMVAMEATNNGADYYIQKGADPRALFAELTYKLRLAISDRRTETEEQRTKKTIRTLIDKTYNAVIIHTPEGRIFDVNENMLRMFHLTREEALKCTIADLTGPDAPLDKRTDIISRVLDGEDQFLLWQARRPADGSVFPIEKFLTRINFGTSVYILCNMRDVSKKEQKIEQEFVSHYALDHAKEGILCIDQDGQILFMNDTWSEITGLSVTEEKKPVLTQIDPAITPGSISEIFEKTQGGNKYLQTGIHRDQAGGEFTVDMRWISYQKEQKKYLFLYVQKNQ